MITTTKIKGDKALFNDVFEISCKKCGSILLLEKHSEPYNVWHWVKCKKCGITVKIYGVDG